MQPEIVSKVSKAGLGLCLWVRAMDVYSDVAKEVGPKKARLEEMNAQLGTTYPLEYYDTQHTTPRHIPGHNIP